MTALAWTLLALVWSLLMVLAAVLGARFERDRWSEAIRRRVFEGSRDSEFRRSVSNLVAKVRNDGWTDAP